MIWVSGLRTVPIKACCSAAPRLLPDRIRPRIDPLIDSDGLKDAGRRTETALLLRCRKDANPYWLGPGIVPARLKVLTDLGIGIEYRTNGCSLECSTQPRLLPDGVVERRKPLVDGDKFGG